MKYKYIDFLLSNLNCNLTGIIFKYFQCCEISCNCLITDLCCICKISNISINSKFIEMRNDTFKSIHSEWKLTDCLLSSNILPEKFGNNQCDNNCYLKFYTNIIPYKNRWRVWKYKIDKITLKKNFNQLCNLCKLSIFPYFIRCVVNKCDCCGKLIDFLHEYNENNILISCSEKCKNKIANIKLIL